MGTYHRKPGIGLVSGASDLPFDLPDSVVVSLKELAGACKEGLLAMSVATGMRVMQALLEENVTELAGPKGKHDPDRTAVRHGSDPGSVTLGGRRVPVERPRVRTADRTRELPVPAYEYFARGDALSVMAVERMLAGLSSRRYTTGLEPVGRVVESSATSKSKSAVSRRFVALTKTALEEMLTRRLDDLDIVALMIDGVHVGDHLCVVALGIDIDGMKHPLGLWEGATENKRVVTRCSRTSSREVSTSARACSLSSTVARLSHPPFVRCSARRRSSSAARSTRFATSPSTSPSGSRTGSNGRCEAPTGVPTPDRARRELEQLATRLERTHPGAAASLREGLDETLTVVRLGLGGALMRTLRSTNPVESMISRARDVARNVKRVQDGAMALRWTAAGLFEAKESFRRVRGYRDLPKLRAALTKHVQAHVDSKAKAA